MTKIQHPQTPGAAPIPTPNTQASSPQAAPHAPKAADSVTAIYETSETPALHLHLPIPATLRPIRTHVSQRPASLRSPSPQGEFVDTPYGSQVSAVAQGTLGLVELADPSQLPSSGIWSSPMRHDGDVSWMSTGGQKTIALLAHIDRHLGVWASLLGADGD